VQASFSTLITTPLGIEGLTNDEQRCACRACSRPTPISRAPTASRST
jgi:hypothetical protein